jgi:hypothetical protein
MLSKEALDCLGYVAGNIFLEEPLLMSLLPESRFVNLPTTVVNTILENT